MGQVGLVTAVPAVLTPIAPVLAAVADVFTRIAPVFDPIAAPAVVPRIAAIFTEVTPILGPVAAILAAVAHVLAPVRPVPMALGARLRHERRGRHQGQHQGLHKHSSSHRRLSFAEAGRKTGGYAAEAGLRPAATARRKALDDPPPAWTVRPRLAVPSLYCTE